MSTAAFGLAFERVVGPGAVARLVDSFTDNPVILLAGDQASGKSTAARLIAHQFGGEAGSTGAMVRARAATLGMSFEVFTAHLRDDPDADVRHDHLAATAIAEGTVVAFESRLAGHLGAWLRQLGRRELHSVYLHCPPKERALRVLERATSAAMRARAEAAVDDAESFEAVVRSLSDIAHPEIASVCGRLRVAAERDRHDRDRIRSLYGIDYTDTSVFDTCVDTSATDPVATVTTILDGWRCTSGGRS
ncbi:MAG: AAA family ATPase [Sandaracinaceae bacterium]|nr:AAA family ATPase [Sandaracinaceae bacterium]